MTDLALYSRIPKEVLKEGENLSVNIFIHLPQNQSIIHFRKPGDLISAEDVKSFAKVSPAHLLIPVDEADKLYELMTGEMKISLEAGDIHSPTVIKGATEVLDTLNSQASVVQLLRGVSSLVEGLISQFKKTSSILAYEEALKKAAQREKDPLTAHHKQVSSIAVLMGLTIGDLSMDDLSDLAAAGMVHDLGLTEITQALAIGHLNGLKKSTSQEKIIYMRHIQLGLDKIKKEKINITPGMQRIIELHHENWDGSGFRAYAGNRTFKPARVLRIADDLVSLIADKSLNLGYQDALEKLKLETGCYDPEILASLLAKGSSAQA